MDKKVTFNYMVEPKNSKMAGKSPFDGLISDTLMELLQNLYKTECTEIAKLKNEPVEYRNYINLVREIINKRICGTNRTCQIVYRNKGINAMELKLNDRETQTSPLRSPPQTNRKKELQDLIDAYKNVIAKVEHLETEFQKSFTERGKNTNQETIIYGESFIKSCFFNAVNILKTVIVKVYLLFKTQFQIS
ncbi:uncharacterized protein LOC126840731 [Adelges cooleyi]|uniref:uncharacterized protein LOC126840731 n=1 Tax=Adelges cooleyi TaxID=133065 RepID=UPI00217F9F6B|nr:uncharacterized protein LOC126840731 [Adelges cooleyi]